MTKRALLVALFAVVAVFCALSTRGALFWMLFWVLAIMLLISLAGVLWTRATLSITTGLSQAQVLRGARVNLTIDVRHTCALPVAPLRLDLNAEGEDGQKITLLAPAQPFILNAMQYDMACPHVGLYPSGVSGVGVRDVFGLFSIYVKLEAQRDELVVLPQIHLMDHLAFSPGDSDNESVTARAFEDATLPTDLRAFQQGDELKKVHWKLSMRKKELIVRVYEQPQRPDALLLVDCAAPDVEPYLRPYVRDVICEAAASLASTVLQDSAPVRMPLLAAVPVDISASRPEEIMVIQDALARCAFDGSQEFERVLMLETRRMRRTGSTAIITSRLNPALCEMILSIRRMGPKVRVLLAADPEEEITALLITRLMRSDVEVEPIGWGE